MTTKWRSRRSPPSWSPARETVVKLGPQATLAIWESGRCQDPLERAVTLLAGATGSSREDAAHVDVGTRDVQLARLLASLTGDLVWACAPCGCGEMLDVAVDVAAVAALPVHPPGTVLTAGTGPQPMTVRLPTTGDLQALVGLDPQRARRLLLARCVHPLNADLPAEIDALVDAALESASPAGAVEVLVRCAGCDVERETALDVPALLWAEVEARALALLEEVHVLAVAYGWTEPEVLALPAQRRATYLQLATT